MVVTDALITRFRIEKWSRCTMITLQTFHALYFLQYLFMYLQQVALAGFKQLIWKTPEEFPQITAGYNYNYKWNFLICRRPKYGELTAFPQFFSQFINALVEKQRSDVWYKYIALFLVTASTGLSRCEIKPNFKLATKQMYQRCLQTRISIHQFFSPGVFNGAYWSRI